MEQQWRLHGRRASRRQSTAVADAMRVKVPRRRRSPHRRRRRTARRRWPARPLPLGAPAGLMTLMLAENEIIFYHHHRHF